MTVSTEGTSSPTADRRAGRELVLESVFRPLANLFVPVLRWARVPPPAVVLANAAVGLVAAFAVARGHLIAAAVLLQLKTLLDNLDGQLARASGQVTLVGRYLDTLADLLVNAALFAALGYVTGQRFLAAASFVALTLVLAVDFNVSGLYRERHEIPDPQPAATGGTAERILGSLYGALFAPLDRAVRSFARWRLHGHGSYDGFTVTFLANLGLTTQLVVLGLCLLLDAPLAYLWFAFACLVALVPLQLRAERRARGAVEP